MTNNMALWGLWEDVILTKILQKYSVYAIIKEFT